FTMRRIFLRRLGKVALLLTIHFATIVKSPICRIADLPICRNPSHALCPVHWDNPDFTGGRIGTRRTNIKT
ncbi:MAG: hypothetical protein ACK40X_13000, partial [Armatimonadota bacterium]